MMKRAHTPGSEQAQASRREGPAAPGPHGPALRAAELHRPLKALSQLLFHRPQPWRRIMDMIKKANFDRVCGSCHKAPEKVTEPPGGRADHTRAGLHRSCRRRCCMCRNTPGLHCPAALEIHNLMFPQPSPSVSWMRGNVHSL